MPSDKNIPAVPPEIDLAKQQDKHQFELAMRTLQVRSQTNEQDRKAWADAQKRQSWQAFWLCVLLLVLFFGFGAFVIHLGKEAFLADILKVVGGFLGGGGVGYAIGKKKSQKTSE